MNETRKERRGFASMSAEKQREIASKGGRAAHQKGTAHEWSSDEAREAGRKGGWPAAEAAGSCPSPGTTNRPRQNPQSNGAAAQIATPIDGEADVMPRRDDSRSEVPSSDFLIESRGALSVQPRRSRPRHLHDDLLNLHPGVVEARASAKVGQRIRDQHVRREAIRHMPAPDAFGH